MRSVSVVLRVAREQLDARGGLGHYPVYATITIACLLISFAVAGFLPESLRDSLPKLQIGLGLVSTALVGGVVVTGRDRRNSLVQEEAIRLATQEALEKIIATPGFQPKPSTSPKT